MHDQYGIRRYREADVGSMGKEKVIALLYEKMIDCYEQAQQAQAAADRATMTDRIGHVQRIVTELNDALDIAIGGDIARNLAALYDYVFLENLELLADNDPRHLENCQRVLRPLCAAWGQIPAGTAARAAQQHAADALGPEHAYNEPREDQKPVAPPPETVDARDDETAADLGAALGADVE